MNNQTMASAYVCRRYGDESELALDDWPLPAPGPREVLLENKAFAVGFPDILTVQGKYQRKPALPFVPGGECCGTIAAVGSAVEGLEVGQAVMGSVLLGAYANRVIVPAAGCQDLPRGYNFEQGAGFQTAYKTAYVGLVERGQLQAGETLLVLGAAGGVGLAAVELGKVLGARVIAAGSNDGKLAAASEAGAHEVVNYADVDLREAIKALTDGRGADVVYDPVGGDRFDQALRCVAPFGRYLVIGFADGRIPEVAANYLLIKQIALVGVRAGEFGRLDPDGGQRVDAALLILANAAQLLPRIHRVYAFNELSAAFKAMINRETIGRSIVRTEA